MKRIYKSLKEMYINENKKVKNTKIINNNA